MAERLILKQGSVPYRPVSEAELDEAVAYATIGRPEHRATKGRRKGQVIRKAYIGQELDRDMLRVLGNTALSRREPKSRLALLAANVVREAVPSFSGTVAEVEKRYEGYKCAVMKMMSLRRVWQMQRDTERLEQGLPIPERPEQVEYPEDERKKFTGQLRLIS